MDDGALDPDVELLAKGIEGIRNVTRLLGEFRRGLLDEGFESEETMELCHTWLIEATDRLESDGS